MANPSMSNSRMLRVDWILSKLQAQDVLLMSEACGFLGIVEATAGEDVRCLRKLKPDLTIETLSGKIRGWRLVKDAAAPAPVHTNGATPPVSLAAELDQAQAELVQAHERIRQLEAELTSRDVLADLSEMAQDSVEGMLSVLEQIDTLARQMKTPGA